MNLYKIARVPMEDLIGLFKNEQQLLIEMYGKIPKSVRGTLLPADQRAKVQHDCLRHMRAFFLRCDLKSFLEIDPMIDKHNKLFCFPQTKDGLQEDPILGSNTIFQLILEQPRTRKTFTVR